MLIDKQKNGLPKKNYTYLFPVKNAISTLLDFILRPLL